MFRLFRYTEEISNIMVVIYLNEQLFDAQFSEQFHIIITLIKVLK